MNLYLFADDVPAIRIASQPVLMWHGIAITNSMLFGWLSMALVIAALVTVAHLVTVRPKRGLVQFIEAGVEFMAHSVESAFEDKARARKYIPFFVTVFFFVLINNWLGLIPGVGEALTVRGVPLLRAFTGDFNGTLAAGVVTMLFVYGSSIRESGSFGAYLRHFFVGNLWNPIYLAVGLLEMITDLTRTLSLSLRLFLNVAIGEAIIIVFGYLGHLAAPITAAPFIILELFVGALQAYIFALLGVIYLSVVANHATEVEREALTAASDARTINHKRERIGLAPVRAANRSA
jgi:F-type H+-transporting ATPase subunit a